MGVVEHITLLIIYNYSKFSVNYVVSLLFCILANWAST